MFTSVCNWHESLSEWEAGSGSGTGRETALNMLTPNMATSMSSTMQNSFIWGVTSITNVSGNQVDGADNQIIGFFGAKAEGVGIGTYNDKSLFSFGLAEVGDKEFTGGGFLSVPGVAVIATGVFTGANTNKNELPAKTEKGVSNYIPQKPGQQALNNGMSVLTLSGGTQVTGSGSRHMLFQNLIHLMQRTQLFKADQEEQIGAGSSQWEQL